MAYTYAYGSYHLESSINVNYRPWFAYEISSTATTYSVTVYAGAQISGNTGPVVQSSFHMELTGTGKTTRSITTSFSTHNADSSKRDTFLSSYTWTWDKGKTSSTKRIEATLSKSNYGSESVYRDFKIPALQTYTVSYNLNDGNGTFPSQTKYHGINLQIWPGADARPAKTGYQFTKWKSTGGYYYDPGDYYTGNADTKMTAQYNPNSFTIKYDANTGTGSVESQTKTYNQSLKLRKGTAFSKTNYKLKKWNTASNGSGMSYALEGTMSATAYPTRNSTELTLYAIWEENYKSPTITEVEVYRSNSTGNRDGQGTYIKVKFKYTNGTIGGSSAGTLNYSVSVNSNPGVSDSGTFSARSGTFTCVLGGGFNIDDSYTVTISLQNTGYTAVSKNYAVRAYRYPIDLLANTNTDNVYMGIMTPATPGITLKTSAMTVSGDLSVSGDIIVKGHASEIGFDMHAWRDTALSVANSTQNGTALCSLTLTPGVWILSGGVRWPANGDGWRRASISTTSGSTSVGIQVRPAVSTVETQVRLDQIAVVDSTTTYYLNCMHNTGTSVTSLTMPASGKGYGNFLSAVRIR